MTAFFIPTGVDGEPSTDEQLYVILAEVAGCQPLPPDRRIESITFRSRGELWTATVGELLHGTTEQPVRRNGTATARTVTLQDPARVVAIFEGLTTTVVTDGGRVDGPRSRWETTILAGDPTQVSLFDPPDARD